MFHYLVCLKLLVGIAVPQNGRLFRVYSATVKYRELFEKDTSMSKMCSRQSMEHKKSRLLIVDS